MIKKFLKIFAIFFLAFIVLALSLSQRADPDMYGHIAAGNVIAHHGLINQDLLISQGNEKYEWIPFEWGFQYIIYEWTAHFGFSSYTIFITLGALLQIGILYLLLRHTLRFNFHSALISCLLYVLIEYNYLVGRPQLLAASCFLGCLFFIFHYIQKNKNFLYFLLPITYIWSNVHGSVILGIIFCFFYSLFCILYFSISHSSLWAKKAKILALYAVGMSVVSILPPQGYMQYRVLFIVLKYSHLLQTYNAEWQPVIGNGFFLLYILATVPFLLLAGWLWKKKHSFTFLLLLPILLLIPYGATAGRSVYFGFLASVFLFGWISSQIPLTTVLKKITYLGGSIIILFLALLMSSNNFIYSNSLIVFPSKAADFIKQKHLQGNMFNQFYNGGYLEYRLYPEQKVFVDGRTYPDPCCKMRDYYQVALDADTTPFETFRVTLKDFLNEYHISYVILSINGDSSGEVISQVLQRNPSWFLGYRDSISVIYVKKDGKNTTLSATHAAHAQPFPLQ